MTSDHGRLQAIERQGYELEVHALSPVVPSVHELLAQVSLGGLQLELDPELAPPPPAEDRSWSRAAFRVGGEPGRGFVVEVLRDVGPVRTALAEARRRGDAVPDEVLESAVAYRLAWRPAEEDVGEAQQAGLALAAWGLATMGEGLVHDPQEEFFADGESFYALLMDDEFVEEDETPPSTVLPEEGTAGLR